MCVISFLITNQATNMEGLIELIINDINQAMPVYAPIEVQEDVNSCMREILAKHLSTLFVTKTNERSN